MSEKKGWGTTVLGWFVVRPDDEGGATAAVDPGSAGLASAPDASGAAGETYGSDQPVVAAPAMSNPPPAPGGVVDYAAVFTAAGVEPEQQERVEKAAALLGSLPAETPPPVKKQIVEASLKAFGVPIDKIIEAGVEEIQALEAYIRAGAADTQKVLSESQDRITKFEDEIKRIKQVMDERVSEQQGVVKSCNERKLDVQRVLEFFGQEAVARVVRDSPKLIDPSQPTQRKADSQELTMANGFFARIGNLWRGFLSLWISDIEKEHPEIAYENAINSMIEKYSKLKSATAAIIRRREDLTERVKQATADLAQTEAELNVAVESNQDDLAVVLIQKKNQLTTDLGEMRTDAQTAQSDADSAKASLIGVQSEIRKLKAERDTMLARMQSAQARLRIQDQLEGLSVDAEVKALDNVREHIKNTIAEANLGKELSDSSLDSRLAALRTQAGDVQAKQQLADLKAKKAAAQAAAGQKTM